MPEKNKNPLNQTKLFSQNEESLTNHTYPSGLPLIHCKCGAALLVVPDVKAMDKAIENHLATHRTIKIKGQFEVDSIDELRNFLIAQVFKVVAKA